jgi:hypothetical protein
MKTNETFTSLVEAQAFVKGINYVGDIDVDVTEPVPGIEPGTFTVSVIVGGEDLDENKE